MAFTHPVSFYLRLTRKHGREACTRCLVITVAKLGQLDLLFWCGKASKQGEGGSVTSLECNVGKHSSIIAKIGGQWIMTSKLLEVRVPITELPT